MRMRMRMHMHMHIHMSGAEAARQHGKVTAGAALCGARGGLSGAMCRAAGRRFRPTTVLDDGGVGLSALPPEGRGRELWREDQRDAHPPAN